MTQPTSVEQRSMDVCWIDRLRDGRVISDILDCMCQRVLYREITYNQLSPVQMKSGAFQNMTRDGWPSVGLCTIMCVCVSGHSCACFCSSAPICVTCVSEGTSLEEQVRRIKDIEAIESDSFVPQAFKSSRDDIKVESSEVKQESEKADCLGVSLPMSIVYNDSDTLAHPSLFMDKEKAEELWLNRLISLRQERLMGSPVT
uniref:Arginine/serine-rich coiled-coil 1 n=1 Tax=Sphaeramia orbicularis TaxID=375764 RepID=A0A672Y6P7_9TELE